jgi:hypothetical protein
MKLVILESVCGRAKEKTRTYCVKIHKSEFAASSIDMKYCE